MAEAFKFVALSLTSEAKYNQGQFEMDKKLTSKKV